MNICDSTVWNGVTYKKTGIYVYHTTNSVGCDSAATLNLTIKKPTDSWTDLVNCDSAYWNGVWYKQSGFYVIHLINKAGCDSAAALNLTIVKAAVSTTNLVACDSLYWNGVYYKASGQYVYHTIYQGGCDSAATLNLTIKKSSSSITNITACDTFTWHGNIYQGSGIYTYHTTNSIGCDSAAILNLTIKKSTNSWTDFMVCDSILWNGKWYKQNGIYTYHTNNKAGCDSTAIMSLTMKKPTYSMTDLIACDSTIWFGFTYKTSGQYTYHITNAAGCDSSIILNLTITKSANTIINKVACDSFIWNGITYKNSGQYIYHINKSSGCDSAVTLNLTIKKPTYSYTDIVTCDSTIWNGITHKITGQYIYHTLNSGGCDSAAILNLTIKKPTYSMTDIVTCSSATWNGNTYTNSGQYVYHTINKEGCDSAAILNLTINISTTTKTTDLTGCIVTYNGKTYTTSTKITDTVKTKQGCDSIYNVVNITINSNNSFSGNIVFPNNKLIPSVACYLSGTKNDSLSFNSTYSFGCLTMPGDYTFKIKKKNEVNKTNGVTAVDIALTQSHILGKTLLKSPFKIIAADVNGDNKITALDIVFMKRLILGLDTTFTYGTAKEKRLWSFVDSSYKFPDTTNPFPYKDSISYTGLSVSKTYQTFIGCKLGDVNWDWNPAVAKPVVNNSDAVELSYSYPSDALPGRADGYIHILVRVKNFKDMSGMQFTIRFDPTVMQWQAMGNNPLGIETGNNHAGEGSVTFLWVDPKNEIKTLDDGSVLMELVFKAIDNGRLIMDNLNTNTLSLDGSVTAIAAYDKDYELHNVVMRKVENVQPLQQETWTVSPNPTNGGLIHIQMNLREKKSIIFRLTDNTGRLILTKKAEGVKGINNIVLREGNIAAGAYYLQAVGVEGVKQLIIE